jgi:cytoskeletal protein CcmA (bactofilin family)
MLFNRIVEEAPKQGPTSRLEAQPANAQSLSIIGPNLVMQGDLQGADDLHVGGQVNGNIRCRCLTLERGGRIIGNIVAEEIVVRGVIRGIVRGRSVTLEDTARVDGEIYHTLLAVEPGAAFEGMSRRRENPMQCVGEEVLASAAEVGADPISLKYLIRPLLALRDADRGDPVAWAKELSLAAGCHDSEVLSEAAKRLTAGNGQCPSISEIVEECERIDLEIGGQKSLSAAMYRTYALGAREWTASWGPLPGQRGCRLRRDEQDAQWREIIRFIHSVLMAGKWAEQPADVVGVKILQRLEQNSGSPVEATWIPRRVRTEFGIPTTPKAMETARAQLESIEAAAPDAAEPNGSWQPSDVTAA